MKQFEMFEVDETPVRQEAADNAMEKLYYWLDQVDQNELEDSLNTANELFSKTTDKAEEDEIGDYILTLRALKDLKRITDPLKRMEMLRKQAGRILYESLTAKQKFASGSGSESLAVSWLHEALDALAPLDAKSYEKQQKRNSKRLDHIVQQGREMIKNITIS